MQIDIFGIPFFLINKHYNEYSGPPIFNILYINTFIHTTHKIMVVINKTQITLYLEVILGVEVIEDDDI